MFSKIRAICFCSLAVALSFAVSALAGTVTKAEPGKKSASCSVPFVGCKLESMTDTVPAPKGSRKTVWINPTVADRLAYYAFNDAGASKPTGVLAPRGWHGYGNSGSSGARWLVIPGSKNKIPDLFKGPIAGPAVEVEDWCTDTSGRFEAAAIIARVFPSDKKFVQTVIEEKIAPASDFPFGPYKKDKLIYLNEHAVEFQTPANSDGLGTHHGALRHNASAIFGVAILTGSEVKLLRVQLQPGNDELAAQIIQQFERDNNIKRSL